MNIEKQIFHENELEANSYTAKCLFWSAAIVIATWILTFLRVFITELRIMNVASVVALVFLVIPYAVQQMRAPKHIWWKYVMILSFIFGIAVLSSALSMHLVAAWACPILVACHYYSPRFTRHSFLFVHVAMLLSFLISIHVGVWDSNIYHSADQIFGFAARFAYIQAQGQAGFNIYQRALVLFYLPRAAIITIIYFTSTTLSQRTHNLIVRNSAIERQRQTMETELNVATSIQASMLPSIFPAFPERTAFDIVATMTPAREVGGDFYDFFLVDDDHLAIVIADVSGKGVPAALFMVISKTLLKNTAQQGCSPKQILETVNNQLCEGNDAEMFVTVWLGIYEISTGKLVFANAGHEHPALQKKGEDFQLHCTKHGLVLAAMENVRYVEHTVTLEAGDTLFVYTDGVPEATNGAEELFGNDRMIAALNAHKNEGIAQLLDGVKADVDAFVADAPQFDDLTMLAFRVKSVG